MFDMFRRGLSSGPEASETAEPLFGSLIRIEPTMFSGAVSLVILAVICFELAFHNLNHYTTTLVCCGMRHSLSFLKTSRPSGPTESIEELGTSN
jgi:hypothetical protein